MTREPFGRRYWYSLTGVGRGPTVQRNWRGQPFWRRYLASFFVLPQPAHAPHDDTVAQPRRIRSPRLLRYQSLVVAGAAALVVAVVSVSQSGGGAPTGPSPGHGPIPSPTGTAETTPSATQATTASNPRGWQGSLRVDGRGEHVTGGPTPAAGQVFGLGVSGSAVLNGMGNLALWTDSGDATKAGCFALLQSHAVYDVTVSSGSLLCLQALDGSIATAKVTADGQDAYNGYYVDLDVVVYPS